MAELGDTDFCRPGKGGKRLTQTLLLSSPRSPFPRLSFRAQIVTEGSVGRQGCLYTLLLFYLGTSSSYLTEPLGLKLVGVVVARNHARISFL